MEYVQPEKLTPPSEETVRSLGKTALYDGFYEMDNELSPCGQYIHTELSAAIVNQDAAIDAVVDALDSREARLETDGRPIACFAFIGPTGVGKSEMAKTLAELLAVEKTNLIKIDSSNYAHGHEISGLTGSPLGYVGSTIKPVFSKENVEQPGTVVLFDEIEKGAPELHKLLLQIMGDGELRLNTTNNTVSFREAIIILTSNLGAHEMSASLNPNRIGFQTSGGAERADTAANLEAIGTKAFTDYFKFMPELFNRIDKTIVFNPLNEQGIRTILDTTLVRHNEVYKKTHGAGISLSEHAKSHIVELVRQEAHLGARPLHRTLNSTIFTQFGRYLMSGKIENGTEVRMFHRDEFPERDHLQDDPLVYGIGQNDDFRRPPRHRAETATTVVPYNPSIHDDQWVQAVVTH